MNKENEEGQELLTAHEYMIVKYMAKYWKKKRSKMPQVEEK